MGQSLCDILTGKRKSILKVNEEKIKLIEGLAHQKKAKMKNDMWVVSPETISSSTREFLSLSSQLGSTTINGQADRVQ